MKKTVLILLLIVSVSAALYAETNTLDFTVKYRTTVSSTSDMTTASIGLGFNGYSFANKETLLGYNYGLDLGSYPILSNGKVVASTEYSDYPIVAYQGFSLNFRILKFFSLNWDLGIYAEAPMYSYNELGVYTRLLSQLIAIDQLGFRFGLEVLMPTFRYNRYYKSIILFQKFNINPIVALAFRF